MADAYFSGLHDGQATPPDRARQHNLRLVEQQSRLNEAIDRILVIDPVSGNPTRTLLEVDSTFIAGLPSQQLMRLFNGLMDLKAYDRVIALYEKSDNPQFKKSPIVVERIAVTYNMLQQPAMAIAWVDKFLQDPEVVANGLSQAEMYGALGKAYSLQHQAAEALLKKGADEKTLANYRKAFGLPENTPVPKPSELIQQAGSALSKSGEAYEKGFMDGFAYYPGINSVYTDVVLGNVEQAKTNAELVYLATLRDGGLESASYWTTVTMVESLLIMGRGNAATEDDFQKALSRVAEVIRKTPEWRFESTFGKWNTVVRPALEKLTDDPEYAIYAYGALERARQAERYLLESRNPDYKPTGEEIAQSPATKLLAKSHGYRGMSVFDAEMVTNNFSFGGLTAHVLVNRRDQHECRKLLSMPVSQLMGMLGGDPKALDPFVRASRTLLDISNPEEFVRAAQIVIRQNFGTVEKKMEIIDDADRFRAYDRTTKALDWVAGVPQGKEARDALSFNFKTSAMAEFAKGLGDCRHHAQSLQLMFDTWQGHRLSRYLKQAHDSTGDNRTAAIQAFKDLERVRLRTIDVQAHAPIKMKELYRPERPENDPQGFIADTKSNLVEKHSMNMLFRVGDNGGIEDAKLCCAFYQQVYQWGSVAIDPTSIHLKSEADGKISFELSGGELSRVQGAPQNKVPVTLVSEGYSSNDRTMNVRDDPGSIYERGHACHGFDIIESLRNRSLTAIQLEAMRQHAEGESAPQQKRYLLSSLFRRHDRG